MKLTTTFRGDDLRFEGDLPLLLRAIPAGARITRAQATLEPAIGSAAVPEERFHETLTVANGPDNFGLAIQSLSGATIVDLGARRTVERITTTGMAVGANTWVQMDLGGAWMPINNNGLPASPNIISPSLRIPITAEDQQNGVTLPGLSAQRLRVQPITNDNPDPNANLAVQSVRLLSYPSNLVLRLGTLAPVWFKVGDLRDAVTTPDFAPLLQAFLDRGQPTDGIYEVPFILHSDTLTRLRLTIAIEYYLQQPLLAPQLSQLVLPFGYGALPAAQPAPLAALLPLNARVLPRATSARVFGHFDASRVIYGPLGATIVKETIPVSAQQSVANAVLLNRPQAAGAIDLHVEAVSASATLLVTLQEDVGGKPWGASLLPEPIEVKLERPAAGGTVWASAALPEDFTFQAERIYWLIVNIAEGEVAWAVEPAGLRPALQTTRDNGLSWRTYRSEVLGGPVAGLYRLRTQLPQYRQPLQIDVAGHRVSLSAYDALGKVDFAIDLPGLADAFNAALDDAATQRRNTAERIANGAFAAWTRIDRRGGRLDSEPVPASDSVPSPLVISPDAARVYYLGAVEPPDPEKKGNVPQIGVIANDAQPRLLAPISLDNNSLSWADPQALTISPDGEHLYVAAFGRLQGESEQTMVWKIDARSGEPQEFHALGEEWEQIATHLAADPRCRYVYMAALNGRSQRAVPALLRMDAGNLEVRGEDAGWPSPTAPPPTEPLDKLALIRNPFAASDIPEPVLGLLIAPDGGRAYVATPGGIMIVDLDAWAWLGRAWDADSELIGMALSADGTQLYAIAATPQNKMRAARQELLVLDAALLDQAAVKDPAIPAPLAFEQTILRRVRLAVGPSGLGSAPRQDQVLPWVFMAATPDDTRLLIADYQAGQVQVIDTATFTFLDPIATQAPPVLLSVTPESRRAFVLTYVRPKQTPRIPIPGDTGSVPIPGNANNLRLMAGLRIGAAGDERAIAIRAVELDGWTADQWALTGGRVAPVCVPRAAKRSARLGSPAETSGLSQVFPVVAGQQYALRFRALAGAPGAEAELFWLSRECGLLGQITIDITVASCDTTGALPYAALQPHTARAIAPAGADWAELRFRQPFDGYMLLDDVSFGAPAQATDNGDFAIKTPALDPTTGKPLRDAAGTPVLRPHGWQITPEDVSPDRLLAFRSAGATELPGVRLTPVTAAPATLTQPVTVASGQPFLLEFQAFPFGPRSSATPPAVELRWRDSATPAQIIPIARRQFDIIAVGGSVPADATGLDLAFVQPLGGTLDIIQVRLSQPDLVPIPITFLSEAPGALTVSAPVVAYDTSDDVRTAAAVPGTGTPATPPAGCTPTLPDDQPRPPGPAPEPGGDEPPDEPVEGFCPCCETIHPLIAPEERLSEGGMVALGGICPNCHVHVTIFAIRKRGSLRSPPL